MSRKFSKNNLSRENLDFLGIKLSQVIVIKDKQIQMSKKKKQDEYLFFIFYFFSNYE